MKGHVFITNNVALEDVNTHNIHGVYKEDESSKLSGKTRADILADLSCIREGDLIFFYNQDNKSYEGIYQAKSRVFYGNEDIGGAREAPYRVMVAPYVKLEHGISEHELLTVRDAATIFSSIFHKKSLQRGKACTHLFPSEMDALIKIMYSNNKNIPSKPKKQAPLKSINASQLIKPDLSDYSPGNEFHYEKELEHWLTYHLDSHAQCRQLFGNQKNIAMFANYVPVSIGGSNIDLLVIEEAMLEGKKIINNVSVIELKKGAADMHAIYELEKYIRWFMDNDIEGVNIRSIQPMIIAKSFSQEVPDACFHWNLSPRKPMLFKYDFIKKNNETSLILENVSDM